MDIARTHKSNRTISARPPLISPFPRLARKSHPEETGRVNSGRPTRKTEWMHQSFPEESNQAGPCLRTGPPGIHLITLRSEIKLIFFNCFCASMYYISAVLLYHFSLVIIAFLWRAGVFGPATGWYQDGLLFVNPGHLVGRMVLGWLRNETKSPS